MIVYSTALEFNSSFDDIVNEIANWLSYKLRVKASDFRFQDTKHFYEANYQQVDNLRITTDFPYMQSIIYTQPDSEIEGRKWTTEIGLRQIDSKSAVEFSVVLRTDEISTQVSGDVTPTRPKLIYELMQKFNLTQGMPHNTIIELTEDNAQDIFDLIVSPSRRHPLLIVSPNSDKNYPISPKDLHFQLCGLADVILILPEADTYQIERILSEKYAAWLGALNIIYPQRSTGIRVYPRSWRYFPNDVQNLIEKNPRPELKLLSDITHRMNPLYLRRHISRTDVIDHERNLRLQHARAEFEKNGQSQEELLKLYEEENNDLNQKSHKLAEDLRLLQDELDTKEQQIEDLKDEKAILERKIEGLSASRDYSKARSDDFSLSDSDRDTFVRIVTKKHNLIDILRLFEWLFSDRIIILESAKNSAEKSRDYKYPDTALDLMLRLVTDYWTLLTAGKGDSEARKVFGQAFAAKESEQTMKSKACRAARTFKYKGEDVTMWRHLKDGVADNPAETIRIHFHWDVGDRKIVIGYVGPHLPVA
ncbi:MAG: hypothetical protein ACUVS2_07710 [Candidatus Flexifilum sp.]